MDREAFWQLLDSLKIKTKGNLRHFEGELDQSLRSLPPAETADFTRIFTAVLNETDTAAILDVARMIGCGDSSDGMLDFRRWIVLQGQPAFDHIVNDPDYLGMYDLVANPVEHWYSEFDPASIYREVTGVDLFGIEVADTAWKRTSKRLLAKKYPQLTARIKTAERERQRLKERVSRLLVGAVLDCVNDCGEYARFVFSSGAEIYIFGYECQYQHDPQANNSAEGLHPSIGHSVLSFDGEFPDNFHVWFANRRKLAFGRFNGWPNFIVFDGNEKLFP
jgi:hypothetical protein